MGFNGFMKSSLILIVTITLSSLSQIVHAQSDVASLLDAGDTKQLRQAARILAAEEQNTPENLRLLAVIIEQEFESAPANRIDALSWGCRALGATGDSQYLSLLMKINQSGSAHKKLKKYANKAYQQILASPKVSVHTNDKKTGNEINSQKLPTHNSSLKKPQLIDTKGLIPKPSLAANERQLFAIAKGEWQAIKSIAQQLSEAEQTTKPLEEEKIQILDALSQFLYERHLHPIDNEQLDVLAWICRALGESNNGRYKKLLQNIANQVSHKKLRNYALEASNSLTHSGVTYVIDSVNFYKIITNFKQAM